MNVEAILAMFTPAVIFFMFVVGLVGLFVGYMVAMIRINGYLKIYYPKVNFQERPKKRLDIIAKRKDKAIPEPDEFKEEESEQKEKE